MENFNDNVPEREKRGFFKVFDICFHRFSKLIGINLLYTVCSLPVILIYFLLSSVISSSLIPAGIENYETTVSALSGTIAIFIFMTLGGGPLAPGFIYVIRNFCRREHSFVVSDFFEHVKKNLRQSIVVFLIDILFVLLILFNLNAVFTNPGMFFGYHVPYTFLMGVISVLYIGARLYLYPLMVTFKSPLKTIFKTSVLLCMLKLPQSVLMVILTALIFYAVSLLPFVFFAFFITPVFLISFVGVINMVFSYEIIKKNIAMDNENDENKPF